MFKVAFQTVIFFGLISNSFAYDPSECDGQKQSIQNFMQKCNEYITRDTEVCKFATESCANIYPETVDVGSYYFLTCFSHNPHAFIGIHYISENPYLKSCIDNDLTKPLSKVAVNNDKARTRCGSVVETVNQVLGESIPLVGVPFYLTHFSKSMQGRVSDYTVNYQLPLAFRSNIINSYEFKISDSNGNILDSSSIGYLPYDHLIYTWNGQDYLNHATIGSQKLKLMITAHQRDWAALYSGSMSIPQDILYTFDLDVVLGNFKAKSIGLGGWLPSNWHFYDEVSGKVYNGDGSTRDVTAVQDGVYKRVASADGQEVYYFDSLGKILFTKTGLTGSTLYTFGYDQATQKLTSITDSFNRVTNFKYDSNGNFSQIVSPENITTNVTLETNGYLKTVTNPLNEVYSMTYVDAGGLLRTFTKPNNTFSTMTYDAYGNLTNDVSTNGLQSTIVKTSTGVNAISALGRVTQNNYDPILSKEIEVNPSGLSTEYTNGTNSSVVSNLINTQTKIFDNDLRFGNQVKKYTVLQSTDFASKTININDSVNLNDLANPFSIDNLSKVTTEGSSEVTSHYDGLTRTNTVTTKLGRSIATQLDSLERPIMEKLGNNLPTLYTYQYDLLTNIIQNDRSLTLTYNPQKLLSSVKNAANQQVSFTYDTAQRLKTKTLPDGRIINYQYDSNNNLVSLTPPSRPVHILNYGSNELLTSYAPPALSGVSNVNTFYSYSNDRELTKITRPDGELINFNYNPQTGLLDTITGSFGTISKEYRNELVTKITDPSGQKITFNYTGSVVSTMTTIDSNNNTLYIYQRAPSSTAGGKVGSETVTVGVRVQNVTYTYDDDKFLTSAGGLSLEYNTPNGQLVKTTLDNTIEHYTYNQLGEVESFTANVLQGGVEKLLYGYSLVRNNVGQITKKTESITDHDMPGVLTNEWSYTYDSSGRLATSNMATGTRATYTYDGNSNRFIGTPPAGMVVYDNQDRLTKNNRTSYTYNANGELLTKTQLLLPSGYVTTNYAYDVFGNLKTAGNVTYQIDPLQRRSARLMDGVMTNKYLYNPEGQLIGDISLSGGPSKTFVYASKSHVPDYFIDENGERYKLIVDHLGSVRLVVKASTGEIIQKMIHDEFGKVMVDTASMYQPFGFAGGIYDYATKLVRFGVRDYDPEIGRWTNKDPIRFDAKDSNLYGYVFSDPVNGIDPKGLSQSMIGGNGSSSGYVDVSGTIGLGLIFTGGVQHGSGVTCAYVGMGVGTPGATVNFISKGAPSTGPSACLAGGAVGGASVSADKNGVSYGVGVTSPGASLTVNGNFICW